MAICSGVFLLVPWRLIKIRHATSAMYPNGARGTTMARSWVSTLAGGGRKWELGLGHLGYPATIILHLQSQRPCVPVSGLVRTNDLIFSRHTQPAGTHCRASVTKQHYTVTRYRFATDRKLRTHPSLTNVYFPKGKYTLINGPEAVVYQRTKTERISASWSRKSALRCTGCSKEFNVYNSVWSATGLTSVSYSYHAMLFITCTAKCFTHNHIHMHDSIVLFSFYNSIQFSIVNQN